ncbi:MAG: hypothetical protein LBK47_08505 [Prevotellaceae bacterium]|nr:hypothetical protein [Prevotellaceae bacterium]
MLTADNSQGTKFDYLPVRCVYGVGEAVAADGAANLQEFGAVTLSINPAAASVASGQHVILSVRMTTTPVSVAYALNAVPTDGGPVWNIGAIGTPDVNISIPQNSTTTDYTYDIRATATAFGYVSKQSNSITVTIKASCEAITQGALSSAQVVCPGTSVTLDGTVAGGSGEANVFRWQSRSESGTWVDINPAVTTKSYTFSAPSVTTYYRRVVSACEGILTHESAETSIRPVSLSQTSIAGANTCVSSAKTFTSTPTGGDTYSYQWQQSGNGLTWSDYSDAGANSASITPVSPAVNNEIAYYRCVVTSCSNNLSDTSNAIFLRSQATLAPTQTAPSTTSFSLCPGGSTTISLGAAQGGDNSTYTYQWYKNGSSTSVSSMTACTAADGTAYNTSGDFDIVASGTANATTYWARRATSCSGNNDIIFTVRSNGNIVQNAIAVAGTRCPNSTLTLTSEHSGGSGVPTYSWEVSTTSATAGFSAVSPACTTKTGSITAPASVNTAVWYRRIVTFAACGSGVSNTSTAVAVTTNGSVAQSNLSGGGFVCPASSVSLSANVTGGSGTPTYQWFISQDVGASYSPIAASNTATYSLAAPLKDDSITYYKRKVWFTSCGSIIDSSAIFTVRVSRGGFKQNVAGIIPVENCSTTSGYKMGIAVSGGGNTYTYRWERSTNGSSWQLENNLDSITIPYAANGGYSDYYRRIVTATSCNNIVDTSNVFRLLFIAPKEVKITVLPEIHTASGMTVNIKAQVEGENLSMIWQSSKDLATWADSAGTTTPTLSVSAPPTGTYSKYYRLKVQPACGAAVYSNPTRAYSVITCPYREADLVAGSCVIRTSGAGNWEAKITDPRDGKEYKIVQMPDGNWWFAQNINYTSGLKRFSSITQPSVSACVNYSAYYESIYWCPTPNGSQTTYGHEACDTYGPLYPMTTALATDGLGNSQYINSNSVPSGVRGICPTGWHVPSSLEFYNLFYCVDGDCKSLKGMANISTLNKLKSTLTTSNSGANSATNPTWESGSGKAGTDEFGFSVLPNGLRPNTGAALAQGIGYTSSFINTTDKHTNSSPGIFLSVNSNTTVASPTGTWCNISGGGVRCVSDSGVYTQVANKQNKQALLTMIAANPTWNAPTMPLSIVNPEYAEADWKYSWSVTPSDGKITLPASTAQDLIANLSFGSADIGKTYEVKVLGAADGYDTAVVTQTIAILDACPYVGTDLVSCSKSSMGMKNWFAVIRDSRDGELYNIAQQEDGHWWFREGLRTYAGASSLCQGWTFVYPEKYTIEGPDCQTYGRYYQGVVGKDGSAVSTAIPSTTRGLCPAGWHIPSNGEVGVLFDCQAGNCASSVSNSVKIMGLWASEPKVYTPGQRSVGNGSAFLKANLQNQLLYYSGFDQVGGHWDGYTYGGFTLSNAVTAINYSIPDNSDAISRAIWMQIVGSAGPIRCVRDYCSTGATCVSMAVAIHGNLRAANGAPFTFTAQVNGGIAPYTYYWNEVEGVSSYTTAMGASNITVTLRVVDSEGVEAAASRTISTCSAPTLTATSVSGIATSAVSEGTNPTIMSGGKVTLNATPSAEAITYWYDQATGGSPVIIWSSSYTTPVLTANKTYYAEAKSIYGCGNSPRTAFSISIENPTSTTPPANTTICSGCGYNGTTATDIWVAPYDNSSQTFAYPFVGFSSGATSLTDGRTNTSWLVNNNYANQGILRCTNRGHGWYVPSVRESLNILANSSAKSKFASSGAQTAFVTSTLQSVANGTSGLPWMTNEPSGLESEDAISFYRDTGLLYDHSSASARFTPCVWRP